MALEETLLRERLKAPTKKAVIQRAIRHEERIRFHCEVAIERQRVSGQVTDFLTWVSSIIPADKFKIFQTLFRYPAITVQETGKMLKRLAKVFDGQNPVYKIEMTSPTYEEDMWDYIKNVLGAPDMWRTDGLEQMWLAINSVIVVDFPKEQTTARPEPYFYFLDICNVVEWEDLPGNYGGGQCKFDWIIIKQGKDRVLVMDDETYRIVLLPNEDRADYVIESTIPHEFGECPVHWFWSQSVSKNDPYIKLHPVSIQLPQLDWLAYFKTSKKHLDTYAPYPIITTYEQDCEYHYEEGNEYHHCDRGFLRDQQNLFVMLRDGTLAQCPACSSRKLSGAGSHNTVPKPGPENGNKDMLDAVKIVTVERDSLDYNVEEIQRLENELLLAVTGFSGEAINDQATNEKQVMSVFEGQKAILMEWKKNWEINKQWTYSMLAKGRHGVDNFVSCSIDEGTDWFLFDADLLYQLYQDAVTKSMSPLVLDMLLDQYIVAKFRNNPDELQRQIMLKHLEPFVHIPEAKVFELFKSGFVNRTPYLAKLNFLSNIARFEREQGSLLEFGKNLDFNTRISKISTILSTYGKDYSTGPETIEPIEPKPVKPGL